MPRLIAITRKSHSASFQVRVEGFVEPLRRRGFEVVCRQLPHGSWQQRLLLREAAEYDGVWWQRHLPQPWVAPRVRRAARRLVFDYDDPLTYSARDGGRPSVTRRIRFAALLGRCDAALAASQYLAELARPYCDNVVVQPMPVDVPPDADAPPLRQRLRAGASIELLWLGSRATQPYLDLIRPALETVGRRHANVRLRLVAHEPMRLGPLAVDFRMWSPDEQAAALRECHIGLCPMPDTIWTRGKCPYKVLQYMAHAMPWVGSAVGENRVTAGDGTRGLCADDDDAWVAAIERLIDDAAAAEAMGAAARVYVRHRHSRDALTDRLIEVWTRVIESDRG